MSDPVYTTDFIINGLTIHKKCGASFVDEFVDAVIARLRAADKLCEAAEEAMPYLMRNSHHSKLCKAIAEYEAKEEN